METVVILAIVAVVAYVLGAQTHALIHNAVQKKVSIIKEGFDKDLAYIHPRMDHVHTDIDNRISDIENIFDNAEDVEEADVVPATQTKVSQSQATTVTATESPVQKVSAPAPGKITAIHSLPATIMEVTPSIKENPIPAGTLVTVTPAPVSLQEVSAPAPVAATAPTEVNIHDLTVEG